MLKQCRLGFLPDPYKHKANEQEQGRYFEGRYRSNLCSLVAEV